MKQGSKQKCRDTSIIRDETTKMIIKNNRGKRMISENHWWVERVIKLTPGGTITSMGTIRCRWCQPT